MGLWLTRSHRSSTTLMARKLLSSMAWVWICPRETSGDLNFPLGSFMSWQMAKPRSQWKGWCDWSVWDGFSTYNDGGWVVDGWLFGEFHGEAGFRLPYTTTTEWHWAPKPPLSDIEPQIQLIESQKESFWGFWGILREFERLSKSLKVSQTQAKSSILGDSGWEIPAKTQHSPQKALTGHRFGSNPALSSTKIQSQPSWWCSHHWSCEHHPSQRWRSQSWWIQLTAQWWQMMIMMVSGFASLKSFGRISDSILIRFFHSSWVLQMSIRWFDSSNVMW